MHRLALGIAGAPGNTYICTPCRLKLAIRGTHQQAIRASIPRAQVSRPFSHSRGSRDDNPTSAGRDEASASKHASNASAVANLPKSMRTVALSVLDIPLKGMAEVMSAESTEKSQKRQESDKKAIEKTLAAHESLAELVTKLQIGGKGQSSGRYNQDRKLLRTKIKALAGSIRNLLDQRFPEDSEYHEPLLRYTESMQKLSEMLLVNLNESSNIKAEKNKKRSEVSAEHRRLKAARLKALGLDKASQDQEPETQGTEEQKAKGGRKRIRMTGKTHGDLKIRLGEFKTPQLVAMSPEQTSQILRLVNRLHGKYSGVENIDDQQLQNSMLVDISAVFTNMKLAEDIRAMLLKRIKSSSPPSASEREDGTFRGYRRIKPSESEAEEGEPISGLSISQALKALKDRPAEPQEDEILSKAASVDLAVGHIDSAASQLNPIEVEQPPVRGLSYGLDRVLFNKGVYQLQDLRSRVYNFDPYLTELIPVEEFNFDLLQGFITSSKDTKLLDIARSNDKRYTGSSSSMTSVLSHFHYLLSRNRPINLQQVSGTFPLSDHHHKFTKIATVPAAIFLRLKDGVYAIDSDKEFGSTNVLSLLGNSLEKLLTLSKEDYLKYRKDSTEKIPEEQLNAPETYHYTGLGDMLMRSQLDAHDPRLPGTGMFDLKTRATWPIRMNVDNYQDGRDYEIRHHFGLSQSYEREYVDMLRATMMKYMLQVRIGRMDGIFVAFHNTRRIFGFQYLPLEEIDLAIHGQADRSLGDQEFKLSVKLMNDVLNRATERFPNSSIRLLFNTIGGTRNTRMLIFAQPVTEDDANEIQHKNDKEMAAITEEIMAGKFPEYDEEGMRIIDYSVLDQQSEASARRYGVAQGETLQASELTDEVDDVDQYQLESDGDALHAVTPVEVLDADIPADLSAISEPEQSAQDPSNPEEAAAATEQVLSTDPNAPIEAAEDEASKRDHDFDGDESFIKGAAERLAKATKLAASGAPLLAMELLVENFVNGTPTKVPGFQGRLNRMDAQDNMDRQAEVSSAFAGSKGAEWAINYELKEYTDRVHAWQLFLKTQEARHDLLYRTGSKDVPGLEKIRNQGNHQAKEGKKWRAERDEEEQGRPRVVVGEERPGDDNNGKVKTGD